MTAARVGHPGAVHYQSSSMPTKSRNYVGVKVDGMEKYVPFSNIVGVRA
jgi:hypothetical protein